VFSNSGIVQPEYVIYLVRWNLYFLCK